jgi:hypothetical protein
MTDRTERCRRGVLHVYRKLVSSNSSSTTMVLDAQQKASMSTLELEH